MNTTKRYLKHYRRFFSSIHGRILQFLCLEDFKLCHFILNRVFGSPSSHNVNEKFTNLINCPSLQHSLVIRRLRNQNSTEDHKL